jgi:hypothetical protein
MLSKTAVSFILLQGRATFIGCNLRTAFVVRIGSLVKLAFCLPTVTFSQQKRKGAPCPCIEIKDLHRRRMY